MPFVTDEVVTAAKLNMATFISGSSQVADRNGFTNTTFADLDALTGGTGSFTAAIVTVTTGTAVKVTLAYSPGSASAGSVSLSYRISGATTVAASEDWAIRNSSTVLVPGCYVHMRTGLTAGSNTFELQAKVTAGTGRIINPTLIVEGIV